jgi:peptide/nickel transport system permease protein
MTAGRTYIRDFWPLATFPGVAIFLALFGFNVLGDGLRDAMDPKLKD